MAEWTIRDADEGDAAACAALYAPYVTDTAITFELVAPDPTEMAARIVDASGTHAWIVAERDGRIAGYAYAHPFAQRAAYRWSCETSIYLEMGLRRAGLGRALYDELFTRLVRRGFRRAMAGMTLPNEASAGLHRAMGFEPAGTFHDIGYKNGTWHDVAWMQKALVTAGDPPGEPI